MTRIYERGITLRKRLGCLHAHYSNIKYIEDAMREYDVELVHFVDPALMYRVTYDESFQRADAVNKVIEQLEWIAYSHVDAILMTCTNYIAMLPEEKLSISLPIIKVDEPFFHQICDIDQSQMILFTNPATVEGTMSRLYAYANDIGRTLDVEVIVIQDTFEYIMQGRQDEYTSKITEFLHEVMKNEDKVISVAQLSMVEATEQMEYMTSRTIINPLKPLVSAIVKELELDKLNY